MAVSSPSPTQQWMELAKNPVVLILAAVLSGGSSGVLFGRPDPFTGSQGRDLTDRVVKLEKHQLLDDQHRIDAVEGYRRIDVLETSIAAQTQATLDLREDVRLLRSDLRDLLRRLIIKDESPHRNSHSGALVGPPNGFSGME